MARVIMSAGASVGASVKFHPSRDFVFPKMIICKRPRYCQRSWFDKFDFLHYDTEKDALFCHTCIQAVRENKIRKAKRAGTSFVSTVSLIHYQECL